MLDITFIDRLCSGSADKYLITAMLLTENNKSFCNFKLTEKVSETYCRILSRNNHTPQNLST